MKTIEVVAIMIVSLVGGITFYVFGMQLSGAFTIALVGCVAGFLMLNYLNQGNFFYHKADTRSPMYLLYGILMAMALSLFESAIIAMMLLNDKNFGELMCIVASGWAIWYLTHRVTCERFGKAA